jgi:uncharacterized membrane protein YraQ (UPF0718 family)
MSFILNLIGTSLAQVGLSLMHNWPYLLAGILIAALLKRYVDAEKVSSVLLRFRGVGVLATTIAAVATPLCSCGTTAVVLGMMASTMPWAPIVAFMVASPLTSPEELLYSAGLFGWPFALAFFLASVFLGLAGGAIAAWIENWGWLRNQVRFMSPSPNPGANRVALRPEPVSSCGCSQPAATIQPAATGGQRTLDPWVVSGRAIMSGPACACSQPEPVIAGEAGLLCCDSPQPVSLCACEISSAAAIPIHFQTAPGAGGIAAVIRRNSAGVIPLLKEFYNSGRQLLPMFMGFAFIGYFLNGLIPASWVAAIFGAGNIYSVALAATLGLPLYINTEGSLPLVRALLDHGMSQGAALAFMISGAGTSFGAVAGALTIARWRVVALVVSILWLGAILSGYVYDLLLIMKVF